MDLVYIKDKCNHNIYYSLTSCTMYYTTKTDLLYTSYLITVQHSMDLICVKDKRNCNTILYHHFCTMYYRCDVYNYTTDFYIMLHLISLLYSTVLVIAQLPEYAWIQFVSRINSIASFTIYYTAYSTAIICLSTDNGSYL